VGAAGEAQAYGVTSLVEGDAHESQPCYDRQVLRGEADAVFVPDQAKQAQDHKPGDDVPQWHNDERRQSL